MMMYLIKAVKKTKTIIEVPKNIIADEKFKVVFEITKECQNFNELANCNQLNLKLSNTM